MSNRQDKSVQSARAFPADDGMSYQIQTNLDGAPFDGPVRAVRDGTNMSISERIGYALNLVDWDRYATHFNRSKKQLMRYATGETDVPLSVLSQISLFSGLPLDWLAAGRPSNEYERLSGLAGDHSGRVGRTPQEETASREAPRAPPHRDNEQVLEEIVQVPCLTFKASAGYGRFIDQEFEETMPMPRAMLQAAGVRPSDARLIQVSGVSMVPTLYDSEYALFDSSLTAVADGLVYVFLLDHSVYVKRLRSTRDALIIMSDNEDYPDDSVVPDDDFKVLGRVKSAWRPV